MTRSLEMIEQCPVGDLGAYLDGELPSTRRAEVERHIAGCADCNCELNFQKKMLLALEAPLGDAEIELPKDFTKRVVTAAESRVDGLRRPKERLNALFICTALFLFSLFALGTDMGRVFGVASAVFDVVVAVTGTIGHFVLDMGLAAVVILRTLFLITFSGSYGPGIFAAVIIAAALVAYSRHLLKQRRA